MTEEVKTEETEYDRQEREKLEAQMRRQAEISADVVEARADQRRFENLGSLSNQDFWAYTRKYFGF
jgi:hypothetical protein